MKNNKLISKKNLNLMYIMYILLILFFSCMAVICYTKYREESVLKEINYSSVDNSSYDVYYNGEMVNGRANEEGFIRKYTNYIDFNFDYALNFSKIVSGTQELIVKASLIVYAPNSETIIYRSDVDYILPSKKIEYENAAQYKFNNKFTIDYKKYLSMYEKFKEDSSIVSNAKILVEFISGSVAIYEDIPKIIKTDTITYDIPLSDVTFGISKKTNITNEQKTAKKINDSDPKKLYLGLLFLCILFNIIIMGLIYLRYCQDKRKKGNYKNTLNKILKSYDSIIVNVETIPSLKEKEIINVTSFEELLDAQMETRTPINYCETIKGIEANFMIITSEIVWVYVLKRRRNKNEK